MCVCACVPQLAEVSCFDLFDYIYLIIEDSNIVEYTIVTEKIQLTSHFMQCARNLYLYYIT